MGFRKNSLGKRVNFHKNSLEKRAQQKLKHLFKRCLKERSKKRFSSGSKAQQKRLNKKGGRPEEGEEYRKKSHDPRRDQRVGGQGKIAEGL